MSTQNVHAFLQKASSEPGLKEKVKGLPQGQEGLSQLLSMAKEAGYEFSEQELTEVSKSKTGSGEISQADLEKVAGGTILTPVTIIVATITVCGR